MTAPQKPTPPPNLEVREGRGTARPKLGVSGHAFVDHVAHTAQRTSGLDRRITTTQFVSIAAWAVTWVAIAGLIARLGALAETVRGLQP